MQAILSAGHNRTYLYATNIAINGGKQHPVNFKLNESMILEDCDGVIMQVTFKYINPAIIPNQGNAIALFTVFKCRKISNS